MVYDVGKDQHTDRVAFDRRSIFNDFLGVAIKDIDMNPPSDRFKFMPMGSNFVVAYKEVDDISYIAEMFGDGLAWSGFAALYFESKEDAEALIAHNEDEEVKVRRGKTNSQ